MKKRIICMFLSIAVVMSFMPLFTVQAEAFSTGSKSLIKTKTVTVKPGKTFKSPTFTLSKKMAVQVPINITLSGKIDNDALNYKIKYNMYLKSSNGKKVASYKCPSMHLYNAFKEVFEYDNWIYFYDDDNISKPGFIKGKYYIEFKNTSKRSIKVKYNVKGYTKFAAKAELPKKITTNNYAYAVKAGKIGPGLPVVKSVVSNTENVGTDYSVKANGQFLLYPYNDTDKDSTAVITVTLKTNKKYKFKLKVKAYKD